MFEKFKEIFPNDSPFQPIDSKAAAAYPTLPNDILRFWEELGIGSQMNGYLKVVNPDDFQSFLEEAYMPQDGPAIAIFATAFADLLIWERDCIKQLNFRRGTVRVAGTNFAVFANHRLTKWENIAFSLDGGQFLEARERLGPCAYDECYGYFPALALGGSEKVENLQKVKLREHLMLLSGIVGTIA
jgi:hypothetical protein